MKKFWPHLILIPLLLTIPVVSSPDFDGTLSVFRVSPFQREFVRFVLVIIFFYLNLNVFLPKLYSRKKYLPFTICILICFGIMVVLPYALASQDIFSGRPSGMEMGPPGMPPPEGNFQPPPGAGHHSGDPGLFRNDSAYHQMVFSSVLPFLFSFLSSLFIFRNDEKKELERSKAKAELLNIKYQLQPHFLFNILNSVYSLALLKSDEAPDAILKLSNVMRYVVQESSKDVVELKKETEYLRDYIALQLMRTDSSLDFSYTETGETEGLEIAPFILVNFIENAFKYGYNAAGASKISVILTVKENILSFKVTNTIVNPVVSNENSLKIGLKNTEEHLQQLYPGQHSLKIRDTGESYEADLTLHL